LFPTEARSLVPFARFRRVDVPSCAVEAVHSEKVVLSCAKLDRKLRYAIGHAHDGEKPGL
jgi:hypothetical protein